MPASLAHLEQPIAATVPAALSAAVAGAGRSRLALPTLLFVAGHAPLAFAAGQLAHLASPLAALLGSQTLPAWATLLSDPHGIALLQQALEDALDEHPGPDR